MASDSASIDPTIQGYSLLQTLVPKQTYLCTDVSSNVLVFKRLEEDCLHRLQLHPAIKERLARVRDLPHSRLATLRGVERWNGIVCLVWSWLDGETWDDAIARSTEDLGLLAAALVEAVDALHEMGIVHGSLHGRNVIVRPDRQVWLTHVSPYLYTDPAEDLAAILSMLTATAERLPAVTAQRLHRLLHDSEGGSSDLRALSRSLRALNDPDDQLPAENPDQPRGYRLASVLYATAVAVAGAGVWLGIHWFYSRPAPAPTTFPSLRPEQRL